MHKCTWRGGNLVYYPQIVNTQLKLVKRQMPTKLTINDVGLDFKAIWIACQLTLYCSTCIVADHMSMGEAAEKHHLHFGLELHNPTMSTSHESCSKNLTFLKKIYKLHVQSKVKILETMSFNSQSTPVNKFSPVTALQLMIHQWWLLISSRPSA